MFFNGFAQNYFFDGRFSYISGGCRAVRTDFLRRRPEMQRKRKPYPKKSRDRRKGGPPELIFPGIIAGCPVSASIFAPFGTYRTRKSGRCAENALKPTEKTRDFRRRVGMIAPIRGD
jgi:hypothetical protein